MCVVSFHTFQMNRRTWTVGAGILVVLLAGCLSGGVGSQTVTPTDSIRANATPSHLEDGESTNPCVNNLAYWWGGPYNDSNNQSVLTADRNGVSLGVGYEAGSKVLFVATENGTILGIKYESSERSVAADGSSFHFDEPLNGTHTVVVSAYADTNLNKEYDRGIDQPCTDGEGNPVRTQALTINFSSESGG